MTGQRSFRRILFAWELAAPIAVLATSLMIVLPPRLLKLVTNYTEETVPLGAGATLPPLGKSRPVWTWRVLSPPRPLCTCGEPHCNCKTPAPIHGVEQVAFSCVGGTCKEDTEYPKCAGKTIEIRHTKGVAVAPLRFGVNAASPGMTLTADGFSANATDLPRADDCTRELPMRPPGKPYNLTFTDREAELGMLRDAATGLVVRIDLAPASRDEPSDAFQITTKIGKIHSTWIGALDQIRASADPADLDGPVPPTAELRSEQGVRCRSVGVLRTGSNRLSPGERVRVLALEAALLASGRSLLPAESRWMHACLEPGGSLEISRLRLNGCHGK